MKKSFIVSALLIAVSLFAATAFEAGKTEADYKNPFQESAISYKNVTVYRVLDHRDAYVVMYARARNQIGKVTIPKSWHSRDNENKKAKLNFRPLPTGMAPWMTIITRDGNFDSVTLTMPTGRNHAAWGVATSDVEISDLDKQTLEIAY